MNIGSQIKSRREELRWTQDKLAEELHVSRSAVSNWEVGRNYPDIKTIISISKAMGLPLDELLQEEGDVVDKISADTVIRKKQTHTIKRLRAIVVLLISILLLISLSLGSSKAVSSSNQIESIKVFDNSVTVKLHLPFYRSVDGFIGGTDYSEDGEKVFFLQIGTRYSVKHQDTLSLSLPSNSAVEMICIVDEKNEVIYSLTLKE